ncbi:TRPL translocation defect protein 14-like [Dysidea avara]|uniref:TRPL translocation defect protein 14-like n=1 Tax=Dysidea avara TaxID=196820 RepID=UPI003319352C
MDPAETTTPHKVKKISAANALPLSPAYDEGREPVVYKLVLTGGPCAGKTTAWKKLRALFEEQGWKVYAVPEKATIFFQCGVKIGDLSKERSVQFQENMNDMHLQIEKTFFELAKGEGKNCLVLCDRGIMDLSVFMNEDWWEEYVSSRGLDLLQLRDGRYDQVLHLVTAANGAEQYYGLSTDSTIRNETAEQAFGLDQKLIEAWLGHPCYDIIDNSMSFDEKIRRTVEIVCTRLKKVTGTNVINDGHIKETVKRKFLIKGVPNFKEFPRIEEVMLEHIFLTSDSEQSLNRIEKRSGGNNGSYICTQTITSKGSDGVTTKNRLQLTTQQYEMLSQRQAKHHVVLRKLRRCFVWKWHQYYLDIFLDPKPERCRDLFLLSTYTSKLSSELELPTFLDIGQEVTEDKDYSLYKLSQCDHPTNYNITY